VVAEWAARPVDSGPVTVPVVIRPELAAGAHRDLHFLVGRLHDTGLAPVLTPDRLARV